MALILAALIDAYDSAADSFCCYYTGALLNTDNPRHPFYLVLDHSPVTFPSEPAAAPPIP